jgi:hypothetical protein
VPRDCMCALPRSCHAWAATDILDRPVRPPLPLSALLPCSYRTSIRVWDISLVAGGGAPVVTAVWDLKDLLPPASVASAAGLMSVRWTGQASGRRGFVGPDWVWGLAMLGLGQGGA